MELKKQYVSLIEKYFLLRDVGSSSEPQQEIVLKVKNKYFLILSKNRSLIGMYSIIQSILLELIEQAIEINKKILIHYKGYR